MPVGFGERRWQRSSAARRFGHAKEGVIARQCLLSVVQTAEGLPIAHRVWGGNVAETSTLASAIAEVTRNYPVQRVIVVAAHGHHRCRPARRHHQGQ